MNQRFEHGYAVIIGVDQYRVEDLALPIAASDTRAIYEMLLHPQRGAYLPENVWLLTGTQASGENIRDALGWLQEQVAKDDQAIALIYWAGHGVADSATGQYYLLPSDLRSLETAQADAIGAGTLVEAITRLPCPCLLMVDSSHGEIATENAPSSSARAFPVELFNMEQRFQITGGAALAVLSASQSGQRSLLSDDGTISLFAFHILEALSGHAATSKKDTTITAVRLLDYVSRAVAQSAQALGSRQTPVTLAHGDFPVALLLGGKGLRAVQTPPDPREPLPPERTRAVMLGEELETGAKSIDADTAVGADVDESAPAAGSRGEQPATSPVVQARRLEAAMPQLTRVQQTTELLVMVSMLESEGLRKLLPKETVSGDVIEQEDVSTAPAEITFPGQAEPVTLLAEVRASKHDFEIDEPQRELTVYPDEDSIEETFFLNPLRSSQRAPVTIYLMDQESRRLSILRLSIRIEEVEAAPQVDDIVRYAFAQGNVVLNYIAGDQFGGDKVGGNKIEGGQYNVDRMQAENVALGQGAGVTQTIEGGPAGQGFEQLLALLVQQVVQLAGTIEPVQSVYALKAEIAKGSAADDEQLAGLIQDIAAQVPGAVSSLVALFDNPRAAAAAGGVTRFVVGRLQRQLP